MYKKIKKGELILPVLFNKCMKAWFDICTQVELFAHQLGVKIPYWPTWCQSLETY